MAPRRRRVAARGRGPARGSVLPVGRFARLDRDRGRRTGAPEVILGEGKSVDHLIAILAALRRRSAGAIVSRPTRPQARAMAKLARQGTPIAPRAEGRLWILDGPLGVHPRPGTVALIAAGTSDVPLAEEARAVVEAIGLRTAVAYDVGVAGLHRLERALRVLARSDPEVYLVFAGREGALASVVAGLVRGPVIGVPVSVGYGRGGRGEAALLAMLQSCAPLVVVNIDAAVPAALVAAQWFAPRPREAR